MQGSGSTINWERGIFTCEAHFCLECSPRSILSTGCIPLPLKDGDGDVGHCALTSSTFVSCTVVVAHEVSPHTEIIIASLTRQTVRKAAWKPHPIKRQRVHQSTKAKFKHCLKPRIICQPHGRRNSLVGCFTRGPESKDSFPLIFLLNFLPASS